MDDIRWRVHLRSSPEAVFEALDTAAGRRRFWAESADEVAPGELEFVFASGERLRARVVERAPGRLFSVSYFGGSVARFEMEPDGEGGTDLTLIETGVPAGHWLDNHAGWVSVLLSLKAAVDHAVDLRNHDPRRTWVPGGGGYVDV